MSLTSRKPAFEVFRGLIDISDKVETLYYLGSKNKEADQSVGMCLCVCCLVLLFLMCKKQALS